MTIRGKGTFHCRLLGQTLAVELGLRHVVPAAIAAALSGLKPFGLDQPR
jgi:hypothetical protein